MGLLCPWQESLKRVIDFSIYSLMVSICVSSWSNQMGMNFGSLVIVYKTLF